MLQFHLSPVHVFDFVRLASGEMGGVGRGEGKVYTYLGPFLFLFTMPIGIANKIHGNCCQEIYGNGIHGYSARVSLCMKSVLKQVCKGNCYRG